MLHEVGALPDILIQYVNFSDYLRGQTHFGGIVVCLYRCGDHVLNPSLSFKIPISVYVVRVS